MDTKSLKFRRTMRKFQLALLDVVIISLTYILVAFMFYVLNIDIEMTRIFTILPFIAIFKPIFFAFFGLYRMMLDHFGFEDLMKLVILSFFSNVILLVFFMASGIYFINPMAFMFVFPFEVGMLAFPRVIKRVGIFFSTMINRQNEGGIRTLIIGAGDGGELVLKEIYRNKSLNNIPVAFVDDNTHKIGSQLLGINVVGPIDRIDYFIDQYHVEEVIIAIANLTLKRLRSLIEVISEKNVKIKRLPLLSEVDENTPPKVIDVKIEDLLERQEICLDADAIQDFVKDETVLVTGGGGSIGSELCRQIASHNPKRLIVFDIYENSAYDIQMELMSKFRKLKRKPNFEVLIGSVYDKARVEEVFKRYKPGLVFHAAAYKHVPLMETSPKEAVRTNVLGTYYVAYMARKYHAKNFVLVSSDKAVRPTNIMGATKRYAELIVESFNKERNGTKYSAVRFGNVLGSNGSVIPLFKKQLKEGGPITVTHKDITRYFMTIPEAVGLILQSAVFSKGGEIFILDMGDPIKIKDLAEKMIKLAGYRIGKDIDIVYTGLRPGEKLFEELLVDGNTNNLKTDNDKIFIENGTNNEDVIHMEEILECFDGYSPEKIKALIATDIKSYKISPTLE